MSVTLEVTGTAEVSRWLSGKLNSPPRDIHLLVILFGGDRLRCCDEAVLARDSDGQIVGLATLAPDGELGEGPTVVGLYVSPEHRRRGIGTRVIIRAVERMQERGLTPVRMDTLGTAAARLVALLPEEVQRHLDVKLLTETLDLTKLWEA